MGTDSLAWAVYEQRQALLRRVAALDDAEWDLVCPAPSPPAGVVRLDEPRHTVREVVAHLLVVDELVLRGGALRARAGLRRLEHPGGWDLRRIAPLAGLRPTDLVALLADRGERLGRHVAGTSPAVRRLPAGGSFGRQPLGGLLGRRVLHEWLHDQDIAAAAPSDTAAGMSVPVATAVTEAVLRLLPEAVLPRVGLPGGVVRVVVDLGPTDGGQQRRIWGLDFARRQYGPRVLAPADATIRTTARALALLAHGRGRRLADDACPDIDGDEVMGGAFLSALGASGAPAPCVAPAAVAAAS